MRHILTIVLLVMALGTVALGQQGNTVTIQTHGTPTGSCSGIMRAVDIDNNLLYFCSAATWLAATAGGVTPSGTLTLNHVALGGGTSVVKVDSALVTDGAGALSGATSISTGTAPAGVGTTATGVFAATEGDCSTGLTPTAGTSLICFKSDHTIQYFRNGAASVTVPVSATEIVGKFTGCSGTQYLGADGACHASAGGLMNYTMLSFNSIPQASTKFMCLLQQSTNDVGAACLWPVSGTITTMTCFASVPANGQTITYTLDNNTTPSGTAICTITGAASASLAATTCQTTGLSVAITKGQSASTQEVTSATSGTISGQRCDYTISGAN